MCLWFSDNNLIVLFIWPPFYSLHSVVLGGTSQEASTSLYVNADDRRFILDGCIKLDPSIKHAEIIADQVGLRPGRTELRLERDVHITSNHKVKNLYFFICMDKLMI